MFRTQCVLTLVPLFVGLAYSWDIAVSKGELLEFYINATKTTTVRFENQSLAALAYDEVHNMILYVDKQSHGDAVCGYDISSMENRCFTQRNGRKIQGLAFDPATELCFFSDTNDKSINWFSLKSGSKTKVNVNVLIKYDLDIPSDIAVDSCRGYIYWINKGFFNFTIERSRFNGHEREVFTYLPPAFMISINLDSTSLAIDQQTKKLYWLKPETHLLYHIQSKDLNKKNWKDEIRYRPGNTTLFFKRPNSLTISKKSIFMVDPVAKGGVWEFPKSNLDNNVTDIYKPLFALNNEVPVGIAANYRISEQIQGIQECNKLTGLVRNLRCDLSVCDNYCEQGKCSLNHEGLPECSCNAGYSGKKCEVYACHGYCLNNGVCSLNEEQEPFCECDGNHEGLRCEAVAKKWR